eukprot:4300127-Pleurochrysis_carterae.AAC.1
MLDFVNDKPLGNRSDIRTKQPQTFDYTSGGGGDDDDDDDDDDDSGRDTENKLSRGENVMITPTTPAPKNTENDLELLIRSSVRESVNKALGLSSSEREPLSEGSASTVIDNPAQSNLQPKVITRQQARRYAESDAQSNLQPKVITRQQARRNAEGEIASSNIAFPNLSEAAGSSSQPSTSNAVPTVEEILSNEDDEPDSIILRAYYTSNGKKLMPMRELFRRYPDTITYDMLNTQWKVECNNMQTAQTRQRKKAIQDRMSELNAKASDQIRAYHEINTRLMNLNSTRP